MTLLIRDAQIVDGEGRPPYRGDVFIDGEKIVSVGSVHFRRADATISGEGQYLVPGFIDAHASSDHHLDLLTNPGQDSFLEQGVTTAIGGHTGVSLAPLFYGTLELFRRWTNPTSVNVNWHTVKELMEALEHLPLGVSFGTLIGHATIKSAITMNVERDLTANEYPVFEKAIADAQKEGAFGFSTGLAHIHGRYAPTEEIKRLVRVLGGTGGIHSVYLRNYTYQLTSALSEVLTIAEETGTRTLISWFQPLSGFEATYEEGLRAIEQGSAADTLYFAAFPSDRTLKPIYTLLPAWAQEEDPRIMLGKMQRPNTRARLEMGLGGIDPQSVEIATAPHNEVFVGKTLADIADTHRLSPQRALLKLMEMTKFRATVFYRDIDRDTLVRMIAHPRAMIGSHGHSPLLDEEKVHNRYIDTFPRFLELAVRSEKLLPFEEAVRRITSVPARFFDLKDRGVIKAGKRADLVLLDTDTFEVKQTFVGGTTGRGRPLLHRS